MKGAFSVFAVVVAVGLVQGFPAGEHDEDTEVVVVPLESQQPLHGFGLNFGELGEPVVDTGLSPGGFFSFSPYFVNPFSGFLSGFEDSLAGLRQQLNRALSRIPTKDSTWTDLGKGNSTSTTKIIDGHKVTVNETTYEGEGDGSIYTIRIVEVKPQSEESVDTESLDSDSGETKLEEPKTEETKTDGPKSEVEGLNSADSFEEDIKVVESPETSEDSAANEITKEKPKNDHEFTHQGMNQNENHQDILNAPNAHNQDYASALHETWESMDDLTAPEYSDILDTNDIGMDSEPFEPVDLSNDIIVNQMMADSGVTPNPDAEVFEVVEEQPRDRLPAPRNAFIYPNVPLQWSPFRSMPIK